MPVIVANRARGSGRAYTAYPMGHPNDADYLEPYREAVRRFGAGFEATLWGTEQTQQARFDVMIDLAGFESCVVLDAGCGRGDFAARLHERRVSYARYVGVDALEAMVQAATARGLKQCEFICADFVAEPAVLARAGADYACISGALNTMEPEMARRVVKAAFEAAAQGVVFNFLSDRPHAKWGEQNLGSAHRFDTLDWIDWSLGLSSRVSFTQDYLDGHDATILIRHDGE